MTQLKILCRGCQMPLWECDFNSTHFRIFCDNFECRLFKQNQGSKPKNPEQRPMQSNPINRLLRAGYRAYKEEKRQNYRILRNLKVPPKEAMGMTSRKQTRIYLEQNGYQVA